MMPQIIHFAEIIGPLIYALLEYKLGKTQSGSLLGLILNTVVKKSQKENVVMNEQKLMNQELKDVLKALFDIGKLSQIIKNKGFAAEEIEPAKEIFLESPKAFSEIGIAISQLKSLDLAGEADLVAFIMSNLGIVDQRSANLVIKGFAFAFAGYQLEQAFVQK